MKIRNKNIIIKFLIVFLIVLIIFFLLKIKIVKEIVEILVISFILSYTLRPLYKYICKKININKRVIAAVLVISIPSIIILLISFMIPSLFSEELNMEGIVEIGGKIEQWLFKNVDSKNFSFINDMWIQVSNKLNNIIINLSQSLLNGLIGFIENILSLAVIPVVTYYFLADSALISNKFYLLFPINKRAFLKKMFEHIDKILGKFILSQLFLCLIVGVLSFIVLIVLRVEYPLWLSLVNAIANIVPYFGPIFGAVPAVLVALLASPSKALYTAFFLLLIQQIEGNLLAPYITASSVRIHPLVIILLLLIGEKLGGFAGMILAIPIGVTIKVIYEDINYYIF
ncbi:AI-2E family transporter [Clostridium fallax]|uniref:Predicted PurR-regulated permease PerM n=1 Tax=Clostridium fallax TaxID=1533 RepID=A0A1M4X950_9CLOT|nr:AI-2E family transporter [Clostridium fallax]SHE89642.1 Predicted PurR-regulated permease PerM [Clostridium fallax]SQB07356.1 putative permease [Clostridium fallax]